MKSLQRAIEIACLLSLMALGTLLLPVFLVRWWVDEHWNHEERAA